MPTVMKPGTLTTVEADVAAKWQGTAFWDHLVAMIMLDEGTGVPQMWRRGAAKINMTVGGAPAWETHASLGLVMNFALNDWLELADADLPAAFPGKASTAYTFLVYGTFSTVGTSRNVATKHDAGNAGPYYVYGNSANTLGAFPDRGVTSVNSTSMMTVDTALLFGSWHNLTAARVVVDGTLEGTVASTAVTTNAFPFYLSRRGDTVSRHAGRIGIVYVLDSAIAESLMQDLAADPYGPVTAAATGSVALTGTVADGATEAQIVTGGETIILTLTGDTWVATGATFDAQRQNIIDGLDSAQAEAAGWDAQRTNIPVTAVVRTSDTVVTITLPALAGYAITANETVTATVPATALVGATQLVATPTFTITAGAGVTFGARIRTFGFGAL